MYAKDGYSAARKVPVVALIFEESGEIRDKVVTIASGPNIHKFLGENIECATFELHSHSAPVYNIIGEEMVARAVNRHIGQYVTEMSDGTDKEEIFFSQLKRSISGTHWNSGSEHLQCYLSEIAYRHSTQ